MAELELNFYRVNQARDVQALRDRIRELEGVERENNDLKVALRSKEAECTGLGRKVSLLAERVDELTKSAIRAQTEQSACLPEDNLPVSPLNCTAAHFFVLISVPVELTAVLNGIGTVEPWRVHGHAHTEI